LPFAYPCNQFLSCLCGS